MKLLQLFFLIVAFTKWSPFFGQQVNELGQQLIVLQENISSKAFLKSWKKNKKTWVNSCKTAESTVQIIGLANELVGVYNSSSSITLFTIPELKFAAVCNALLNLLEQFPGQDLAFSDSALEKWKSKVLELIAIEQKRAAELEKVIERQNTIKREKLSDSVMVLFTRHYEAVFEGANKGSFSEIITNPDRLSKLNVNLDFGPHASCNVEVDEDGVYELTLIYSTDSDLALAHLIFDKCYQYITTNLRDGFKESKMFDGNFITNFIKVFDFQGQKFADTAKHPKIQLGIKKESYEVKFIVTEPLFRR